MNVAQQLRLHRRGAHVAEVLAEVEATLAAHPADAQWFRRAGEDVQAEALARLQQVDDAAYVTLTRLQLAAAHPEGIPV